ncbi:4-hydroxybenzoyl-CoA thioesterase/acyl-CoA thioester hydrolase [Paraperlucidibaca baekdonensis]|uniref:4-hydroxybenzoyl-CoA thioesterase/acyl-CoA thioester hydrolase n=1 Tax=Paraperlucidibaca baekdonensis TaxID=748120 RepID=A0A3E0H1K7_9GAMM|nr:tol-pal system-associated acyl-CoA thioesterase [Paraperlucidibaca baekdonensis]REH36780.1 4-hydroxybenzoyl-CoA thioesterase/acyl-CoA thioester hydrolase [Paraperlucidibaca baekdonensis]
MADFHWPVRVYIEDTDAGGIVYYVNYLKFFERARTECLRSFGYDHYLTGPDPVLFVVRHVDIDYKQPARLDDQLIVSAEISKIGRASLHFRQRIWRDDVIIAAGRVEVACVDRLHLKPRALPTTLSDLLRPLLGNTP